MDKRGQVDARSSRAPALMPAGRRTGAGSASLLPYLLQSLGTKPKPLPPGGVERRARPRQP